jgi:hypothetical protein
MTRLALRVRALWHELVARGRQERGEITSQTVLTALLVGLAVTVGGVFVAVATGWIDTLPRP